MRCQPSVRLPTKKISRCRCEGVQPGQGDRELQPQRKQRDSLLLLLVYFSLPLPPASSDPCHVIFVTLSPCEKYPVGGQPRIEKQGVASHFVKYQVDKQPLEALQVGKGCIFCLFCFDLICYFLQAAILFHRLNIGIFCVQHPFTLLTCFWIQFDLCVWRKTLMSRIFPPLKTVSHKIASLSHKRYVICRKIYRCVFLYAKFEMLGEIMCFYSRHL